MKYLLGKLKSTEKKPSQAWLRTKSLNRAKEPQQHSSYRAGKVFNNNAEEVKLFNPYFYSIYEKGSRKVKCLPFLE